MLIPASACAYSHVPYEFRQFSMGTRFGIVFCMFLYLFFVVFSRPSWRSSRDVYVLSQDINKLLSAQKTFPRLACFWRFRNCPMLLVVNHHLRKAVMME